MTRCQQEMRAAAAVESLWSFARGSGGADLQRAVAAALGDGVLSDVGLKVESLLERAEVAVAPPSRLPGASGASRVL